MDIGRLRKSIFADIHKNKNIYIYTYLLFSTKWFKKKYFKLTFQAKYPHYWFTDIMKVSRNEGYFFEDFLKSDVDLSIGTVSAAPFNSKDEELFSKKYKFWKYTLLNDALKKQREYKDKYDSKYGQPEDLGLHKAWKNIN